MQIEQRVYTETDGWRLMADNELAVSANWVLVFDSRALLEQQSHIDTVMQRYPDAAVVFASTAGEIYDSQVLDDSLVVTAIHLEKISV